MFPRRVVARHAKPKFSAWREANAVAQRQRINRRDWRGHKWPAGSSYSTPLLGGSRRKGAFRRMTGMGEGSVGWDNFYDNWKSFGGAPGFMNLWGEPLYDDEGMAPWRAEKARHDRQRGAT